MSTAWCRAACVAALVFLNAQFASAHLIVDVGVSVTAPAFSIKSSAVTFTIAVSDLAYDPAYGVVITDQLAPGMQFLSAKGTSWNCLQSSGSVSCSAESLSPGISTITITATTPPSVGPITNSVSVATLGSIDPNRANDTASAQTIVYDPSVCSGSAPALLAPAEQSTLVDGRAVLSWSPVPSVSKYRIWTAVEGALPFPIAETTATQIALDVEEGETEWWVEAVLTSCPSTSSPRAHFSSQGRPLQMQVSNYAGQPGISGFDDGALTSAKFVSPASLGLDLYGNMYVADAGASTIRRIVSGTVSTITGTPGRAGYSDGTGANGILNHPRALAVSPGGYVYIADTDNHAIRFLYPNGNGAVFGPFLFTIAGSAGVQGTLDGLGSSARFASPTGVAVAQDATLFVGDSGSDRVRRLGQDWSVTSVAGIASSSGSSDGPANAAQFNNPTGIALDGQGNVYVADTDNDAIRRIGSDGIVTTIAGQIGVAGFGDGVGAAASFNHPTALTFDALGNLYVADTGNHAIRRIAPSHFVSTVIGSGVAGYRDGNGTTALLNSPTGMAIDSSGSLFIADSGNNVIRKATKIAAVPLGPARRRAARP